MIRCSGFSRYFAFAMYLDIHCLGIFKTTLLWKQRVLFVIAVIKTNKTENSEKKS